MDDWCHVDALDAGVATGGNFTGSLNVQGDLVGPKSVFGIFCKAPHVKDGFYHFGSEDVMGAITDRFQAGNTHHFASYSMFYAYMYFKRIMQ